MAKGCSNCGSQEEWYPVGDGGLSRCPNCFMTVKASVPRKATAERPPVVEAEAPSVTLDADAERADTARAAEAEKAREKAMEDKEKSRPKDEAPAKEKVIEPPEPPADKAAGKATGGRKT